MIPMQHAGDGITLGGNPGLADLGEDVCCLEAADALLVHHHTVKWVFHFNCICLLCHLAAM